MIYSFFKERILVTQRTHALIDFAAVIDGYVPCVIACCECQGWWVLKYSGVLVEAVALALRDRGFVQATKKAVSKMRRGLYIESELKYKIFFIFDIFLLQVW